MSSLDLTEANSSGTPGVKPTDRDDLASKIDEPPNTKLNDYSDPDAVISAILSDANGPTRCVKHRQSSLQHCRQRQRDTWLLDTQENDVFARIHGVQQKDINTSSRHNECRAIAAYETHMWYIFKWRKIML